MEMKRYTKRYMRLAKVLVLGAAMLSLAGCVKRELEIRPDEGYVEIALDWSASDVASRSARYLFYDEAGALVKEESGVTDCFKGILPTGTYRVVVHNTDAEGVDFRGTDKHETAEVFAKTTDYSEGHHPAEGVPCILEPRDVFAAGGCNESATVEVRQLDTTLLSVTPAKLTKRVKMLFRVNSSEEIRSLSGVLEGVAPGVFLHSGSCNRSSACAVEFTAVPGAETASAMKAAAGTKASGTGYTAALHVFELSTTAQSPEGTNRLNMRLSLANGAQATGSFDITSALKQIIAGNGGVLPEEIAVEVTLQVQAAGLDATVEPWDESGTGSGSPRPQA